MYRYIAILKMISLSTALVVIGAFVLAGCDDALTDSGGAYATTISGTVTNNATFAKAGEVENAKVQAAEVEDDGEISPSEGEATTDENGRYVLETEAQSDIALVTAISDGFESSVLVAIEPADDTVSAMEMNSETHAEADVYVETRRQNSGDRSVDASDIVFFVEAETAAEIDAGRVSASQIASLIRAAVEAEAGYVRQSGGATQSEVKASHNLKRDAFVQLQTDLAGGVSASTARMKFLAALLEAHAEAGIDRGASAEARQMAVRVITALSSGFSLAAQFAVIQRAELLSAGSTSGAIEAAFEAVAGASNSLEAVEFGGGQLRATIAEATTRAQIDAAWADYEVAVKAELYPELSIGSALATALDAAFESAKTDFEATMLEAATVDEFVEARVSFNAELRTRLKNQLFAVADAEFGAQVYILISAR